MMIQMRRVYLFFIVMTACVSSSPAQIYIEQYISPELLFPEEYAKVHAEVFPVFLSGPHASEQPSLAPALAAYRAGKYDSCLELLSMVTKDSVDTAPARLLRGAALLRLGQLEEARADFLWAYQAGPDQAEPLHNMGVAYLLEGATPAASRFTTVAINQKSYHPESLYLMAAVRLEEGDKEAAKQLFATYEESTPGAEKMYVLNALLHISLGENKEALQALDKVEEAQPALETIPLLRGIVYINMNKLGKAISYWQQGYDASEDNALLALLLGYCYIQEGFDERGLDLLIEGYSSRPLTESQTGIEQSALYQSLRTQELLIAFEAARHSLRPAEFDLVEKSLKFYLQGEYSKAIKPTQKAASSAERNPFVYFALGVVSEKKDIKLAYQSYVRAIELNPEYLPAIEQFLRFYDNASMYTGPAETLGTTREKLDKLFWQCLDRASEQYPQREVYHLYKGRYWFYNTKQQEALDEYNLYLETAENEDIVPVIERGTLLIDMERYEEAIIDYRKIVEELPVFNASLVQNYIVLLWHTGEAEAAMRLLQEIIISTPDDIGLRELEGDLLYNEGKYRKSLTSYLRATSADRSMTFWQIHAKIALLYLKLEMETQAAQIAASLQSELEKGPASTSKEEQIRNHLLGQMYYVQYMAYTQLEHYSLAKEFLQKVEERAYEHREEEVIPRFR